eukprot:Rmarinus@m.11220
MLTEPPPPKPPSKSSVYPSAEEWITKPKPNPRTSEIYIPRRRLYKNEVNLYESNIEGDGCIDKLYHLLWVKQKSREPLSIVLPDTVIFKFGQPSGWFFTGANGEIMRKKRCNVNRDNILRTFGDRRKYQGVGDCPVIAFHMYEAVEESGVRIMKIEYFDESDLKVFLDSHEKRTGILQKFIQTDFAHNCVVRATWTPKVCILEKRMNVHRLSDRKLNIYDRVVTYDGPEHMTRTLPVAGTKLSDRITVCCRDIVDHVLAVTYHRCRITRMVVYFKVDHLKRINILWCSSMRVAQPKHRQHRFFPLDLESTLTVPGMGERFSEGGPHATRYLGGEIYPPPECRMEPRAKEKALQRHLQEFGPSRPPSAHSSSAGVRTPRRSVAGGLVSPMLQHPKTSPMLKNSPVMKALSARENHSPPQRFVRDFPDNPTSPLGTQREMREPPKSARPASQTEKPSESFRLSSPPVRKRVLRRPLFTPRTPRHTFWPLAKTPTWTVSSQAYARMARRDSHQDSDTSTLQSATNENTQSMFSLLCVPPSDDDDAAVSGTRDGTGVHSTENSIGRHGDHGASASASALEEGYPPLEAIVAEASRSSVEDDPAGLEDPGKRTSVLEFGTSGREGEMGLDLEGLNDRLAAGERPKPRAIHTHRVIRMDERLKVDWRLENFRSLVEYGVPVYSVGKIAPGGRVVPEHPPGMIARTGNPEGGSGSGSGSGAGNAEDGAGAGTGTGAGEWGAEETLEHAPPCSTHGTHLEGSYGTPGPVASEGPAVCTARDGDGDVESREARPHTTSHPMLCSDSALATEDNWNESVPPGPTSRSFATAAGCDSQLGSQTWDQGSFASPLDVLQRVSDAMFVPEGDPRPGGSAHSGSVSKPFSPPRSSRGRHLLSESGGSGGSKPVPPRTKSRTSKTSRKGGVGETASRTSRGQAHLAKRPPWTLGSEGESATGSTDVKRSFEASLRASMAGAASGSGLSESWEREEFRADKGRMTKPAPPVLENNPLAAPVCVQQKVVAPLRPPQPLIKKRVSRISSSAVEVEASACSSTFPADDVCRVDLVAGVHTLPTTSANEGRD